MKRIYLDNCCFNRPFDDQSQLRVRLESEAKLNLQSRVYRGELELVWSYILDFENQANPLADRKQTIADWKNLATVDVAPNDTILPQAKSFQALGLGNMDSLHLACALASQSDVFFTTDKGILKKRAQISEIQIMNPVESEIA